MKAVRTGMFGLLIQVSGGLALAAQNFLAPLWYGREGFGLAVAILAVPYLLQGLAEPIVISLLIRVRGRPDGLRFSARMVRDLACWALAGSTLTCIVVISRFSERLGSGAGWVAGLAAFNLMAMCSTTLLMGLAYAEHRFRDVSYTCVAACVTLIGSQWMLRFLGPLGIVLSLLLVQLVHLGVLRAGWRQLNGIASARTDTVGDLEDVIPQYAAALAQRLGPVVLNAGSVVVASTQLNVGDLADFKIAIAMTFGSLYAIPIAPFQLQAWLESSRSGLGRHSGKLIWSASALTAWAIALSVAMWLLVEPVQQRLLGSHSGRSFRELAFAVPLLVWINLLGSMLMAYGRDRALVIGAGLGFCGSMIFAVRSELVEAVLVGGALILSVGLCSLAIKRAAIES